MLNLKPDGGGNYNDSDCNSRKCNHTRQMVNLFNDDNTHDSDSDSDTDVYIPFADASCADTL